MKRLSSYARVLRREYTERALVQLKKSATPRALLQWFSVYVRTPALFTMETNDDRHTLKVSAVCSVELLIDKGVSEGLQLSEIQTLLEASLQEKAA